MISKGIKKLCKDFMKIENYERAINDNEQTWVCHHRFEITPCGERISPQTLKTLNMYYDRPAEELIFLTRADHKALHNLGLKHSEDQNEKISEALKGNTHFKGLHHTEETRKKMSQSMKGNTNGKGQHYNVGLHWFNNGLIEVRAKEQPENFTPGRLSR